MYQKILGRVFRTLKRRSRYGEAHCCADAVYRVLYPGILIESQDGEEASYFCACRAALANYPCPKCLVPKNELHCVSKAFPTRTSESMRTVIQEVSIASTKVKKDKILQDHGLHDIEVGLNKPHPIDYPPNLLGCQHFLWDFRFSDPYKALSYDTLHSDDLGKWGKHIWELLLQVLEDLGMKGALTKLWVLSTSCKLLVMTHAFLFTTPEWVFSQDGMDWNIFTMSLQSNLRMVKAFMTY